MAEILLVRGSPSAGAELIRVLAERHDMAVETAGSAEEALARLREKRFDAVVCEGLSGADIGRLASSVGRHLVLLRRGKSAGEVADAVAAVAERASAGREAARGVRDDLFLRGLDGAAGPIVIISGDRGHEPTMPPAAPAKSEAALARTPEMLEAAFRASPVPIVVLDTHGDVRVWNGAAERTFGWSADEVLGKFAPLVPEDGGEGFRELLRRLLDGETFASLQTVRVKKDGTRVDVRLSTAPIRDADGAIIGTMEAIEDITDRIRDQRELRESRERFARLIDNSPDIIFRLRLQPRPTFEFVSPASSKVLGHSPEEFYSDASLLLRIVAEEHRGLLQAVLETPRLTKEPMTVRVIRKDGSEIWMEAHFVFVPGSGGGPDAIEGVVRDVTDRVRALDALEGRTRAAEVSAIKISAYLDFVNHDIANILAPILSYSQLLADRVGGDEAARNMASKIVDETIRASTFITNVRRISNIEKLTDTRPEPLDLREAVRMAVEMSTRMVPDKEADVRYDMPQGGVVTVPGKGYLEDVLQAVATNSLMHSKGRRAELEVAIRVAPVGEKDRYWLLTMADHGPGIPDAMKRTLMAEVFDPREATRRGVVPSIKFMSLIVEALGGEMWLADRVERDPGSGLKVIMMLPDASGGAGGACEIKLDDRIRTS